MKSIWKIGYILGLGLLLPEAFGQDDFGATGMNPAVPSVDPSRQSAAVSADNFMDYLPQHLAHLDPYQWDKVQRGAFIRYRGDPAFPAETIPLIAENCTYIHCQNLPQSTREQFTIPYPKRIYRFAYKNLTKHYEGQDSIFLNVPQWFMHYQGGTPNIITTDYPALNLFNTNTIYAGMTLHEWWVSDMRKRVDKSVPGNALFIDALAGALREGQGGYYDYWGNPLGDGTYHDNNYTEHFLKPLLAKIRDEFSDEMIITANMVKPWFDNDGNYEYVRDYAHCSYVENFERFGDSYTEVLNKGIDINRRVSEDGKMTFFNIGSGKPTPAPTLSIEQKRLKASEAMPEFYNSLSPAEQDDLAQMYAYFEFKLAVFLLGANEYSYFGYQNTVIGDDAGYQLFRVVPPFPEFQYPLGKPLGAAVRNGNVWTRHFEHASVWLDAGMGEASITWGKVRAVNCGGEAFTDANGVEYAADQSFVGGGNYTTTDTISGTQDDLLYQTERYGDFEYNVPVSNGRYNVVLQFAEIYQTQPGGRLFDVLIEGTPVLVDLDIYAEAGHDAAYDVLIPEVNIKDGFLTIATRTSVNNPKLSAFRFSECGGVIEREGFETNMGSWVNVSSGDSHDWARDSGGTPSSGTGPASGADGSAWYMYLETSSGSGAFNAGDSAILEGPYVTNATALAFAYHMYGSETGSLNVDVYDGVWHESIWSISGQQQASSAAAYAQALVDLSPYSGAIKLRFRAVAAGGFRGDLAIDDIEISKSSYYVWLAGHGLSGASAWANANPDGDRFNNYEEYVAGLNPALADSFTISNFVPGTDNTFEWNAVSGRIYKVYWSSNLLDGFTLIESNALNGVFVDEYAPSREEGFYKITVELEP